MTDVERGIIGFTPAPGRLWTAHFKDGANGEEWQLPVAGWAVIRHNETDCSIAPVVVDEDKFPLTIHDYCESRGDKAFSDLYRGLRCYEDRPPAQSNPSAREVELQQLRAERDAVGEALREAGIDDPQGARGVRDLAALYQGALAARDEAIRAGVDRSSTAGSQTLEGDES